jgi:hypothetical protein
VGFVVDKMALEKVFSSNSVSPADSTLIVIDHPGLVQ